MPVRTRVNPTHFQDGFRISYADVASELKLEMNLLLKLLLVCVLSLTCLSTKHTRWFVKTEQFAKPYLQVKPFLIEHRSWVASLRSAGHEVTSGYRVDREGKPGGGGLMFLKAADYEAAEMIILQDPLVANKVVNYELHECIWETGDMQIE